MTAATAFLLTLALETPVYLLTLRRRWGALPALAFSLVANGLTHPLAWRLTLVGSWARYVAVELGVFCVEAALALLAGRIVTRLRPGTRPLSLVEAVVVALSANALSAGAGLLAS
jgi:hypothetical protein